MRVLVDTQCWLWMQAAPERLPVRLRDLLADERHELFLSSASIWELAIKVALGKLRLPLPLSEYVETRLRLSQIAVLPIDQAHAIRVAALPPLHRDPFDRMLIAQAQVERYAIATVDPEIRRYDVRLVDAT